MNAGGNRLLNNILRIVRRKRNITQTRMAGDLNVSPSYLCKVEKGTQEPSPQFMKACAHYLDMPEEELFPARRSALNSTLARERQELKNNLWLKRMEKNLKQYELARMIGCSPSYLSKIEKGFQRPTETFKKKCAQVLKVKQNLLFP